MKAVALLLVGSLLASSVLADVDEIRGEGDVCAAPASDPNEIGSAARVSPTTGALPAAPESPQEPPQ
ncbi:MAG TPA: hypothetical protein VF958_05320, partial [Thermoanaerobaculia bacterium]